VFCFFGKNASDNLSYPFQLKTFLKFRFGFLAKVLFDTFLDVEIIDFFEKI